MIVIENDTVFLITISLGGSTIRHCLNPVCLVKKIDTVDTEIYTWTKFNPVSETWEEDPINTNPITVDEIEYTPIDGKVTITRIPEEVIKTPTLEEQLQSLKQDNLILMDALATVFEEIIVLRGEVI